MVQLHQQKMKRIVTLPWYVTGRCKHRVLAHREIIREQLICINVKNVGVTHTKRSVCRRLGDKTFGWRGTFGRKLRTFGRQHLYDILWDVWEKTIGPFGDKESQNVIYW